MRTSVTIAEKKQSGAQAFATAAQKIGSYFGNGLEGRRALPCKLFLDEDQIVADQIENLLSRQQRDGFPPGTARIMRPEILAAGRDGKNAENLRMW